MDPSFSIVRSLKREKMRKGERIQRARGRESNVIKGERERDWRE